MLSVVRICASSAISIVCGISSKIATIHRYDVSNVHARQSMAPRFVHNHCGITLIRFDYNRYSESQTFVLRKKEEPSNIHGFHLILNIFYDEFLIGRTNFGCSYIKVIVQ